MRALRGRIPRGVKNHRTPEGFAYRAYVTAKLARHPNLPADARVVLREAGRTAIELERLDAEREHLLSLKSPRRARLRRITSDLRKGRVQLLLLERRLEEMAPEERLSHPRRLDVVDPVDFQQEVLPQDAQHRDGRRRGAH